MSWEETVVNLLGTTYPHMLCAYIHTHTHIHPSGNHALGLAYHSKLLGIPVTVVMPEVGDVCLYAFAYASVPVTVLYLCIL
jgi:hypothetical protein